jgi:hypothetical protein
MKYTSGAAFRQALETRLKSIQQTEDVPLVRLRKLVAFDRFLARLFESQPDDWLLKGGFALQIRLGERSRTTKDIDLLAREKKIDILEALNNASSLDLGDYFSFEVEPSAKTAQEGPGVLRYTIQTRLANRQFETFHVDVGIGDPVIGAIEYLPTTDLLEFADVEPACVPCYPVSQQIAEKLLAYTQTYGSGLSSRVKDFIDLLLLAELGQINGDELTSAIQATFQNAGHQVPVEFTPPPRDWRQPYQRTASLLGLEDISFDQAYDLLQKFLVSILKVNENKGEWNPTKWRWE